MADTGEFVTVPDDLGINPSSAKLYATDVLRTNFNIVYEMLDAVERNISDMKDVIEGYNIVDVDVDVDVGSVNGPPFPIKPNWPPLDLDYTLTTDKPNEPTLRPYPVGDFEYLAPIPPADISPSFNWTAEAYTSEMWFALFTEIYNDLVNGGTGLTDTVYSAIIAREQEARRRNQEREQEQAIRSAGANGLNLKAGEVGAVLSELAAERMQRDQDSVNSITIKDFELAQANDHFIKQLALDYEKVSVEVWRTIQTFGFEAEKAAQEFILTVYKANIERYIAAWKGVEIEVEVWKKQIDAITAEYLAKIEIYTKQWDAIETEVKAITSMNDGQVQARVAEIEAYKSEIQAVAEQWRISLEEQRVKLAGIQLEVGTELEVEKINLGSYDSKNKLAAGIYGDITKINSQTMASALSTIHSSNNVSYSGGESKTESLGRSATLHEGRSFRTDLTPSP